MIQAVVTIDFCDGILLIIAYYGGAKMRKAEKFILKNFLLLRVCNRHDFN